MVWSTRRDIDERPFEENSSARQERLGLRGEEKLERPLAEASVEEVEEAATLATRLAEYRVREA
jgi:hypothetical protein